MKKLNLLLAMTILFISCSAVQANDGNVPVVTEAYILPERATAGEDVYFVAKATDPKGPEGLQVGVFIVLDNQWMLVTPLHYELEHDRFVGHIVLPKQVPNGEVTLYFVALNEAGVHSDPVPRTLTIYSLREIIVAKARACLLTGDLGAVKNFHHGDPQDELPLAKGIDVPLGTVLLFQSRYDGVWYDDGFGSMGTTIRLWIGDNEGNWHLIGEDTLRSDILEGPSLRQGIAQVILPCIHPGNYLMKLAVVSAVNPVDEPDPSVDADTVVFRLNVGK